MATTTSWMSNISGPIPSHTYYAENGDAYDRPGTASSARPYSATRAVIKGYQYGADPFAGRTFGVQPGKDHIRENVRKMRELARFAKEREDAKKAHKGPVKASQRFANVSSRVYEDIPERYKTYSRPNSAGPDRYLKAHEKSGILDDPHCQDPIHPISKEPPAEKLTVPSAQSAREVHLVRREIDFIRANANAARRSRPRSASPAAMRKPLESYSIPKEPDNYKRGETPDYLIRRRQKEAEERAALKAAEPDPEQPAGHKKMPDEERRHTLHLLQENNNKLLSELNRLPIRTDTLRVRQRKEELEAKLAEIEEAVKIFSRPKVFVKI